MIKSSTRPRSIEAHGSLVAGAGGQSVPEQAWRIEDALQDQLDRPPSALVPRIDGIKCAQLEEPGQYVPDAVVALAARMLRPESFHEPSSSVDLGYLRSIIPESLTRIHPQVGSKGEDVPLFTAPVPRQPDGEGAAHPQRAFDRYPTAVEVNEILGDGEP